MMLMPRWPRAGPIGGDGVAEPAGTCSFRYPATFLAIYLFLSRNGVVRFIASLAALASPSTTGFKTSKIAGDFQSPIAATAAQSFSTCAYSSSTGVGRPKID